MKRYSVQRQILCHFINQNPVGVISQSVNDLYNGLVYLHITKMLSIVYHLGYLINTTKILYLQCDQIFPEFLNKWNFI